jgi:hypothetical protein
LCTVTEATPPKIAYKRCFPRKARSSEYTTFRRSEIGC